MTSSEPLGPPPGFPKCQSCPYRVHGPISVCLRCASDALVPVAERHCLVCSQELNAAGRCSNALCRQPRAILRIGAIAMYSGHLARTIKRLKYQQKTGWAAIFGRLVVGHLEVSVPPDEIDLIIPNPTWCGDGRIAHTEIVLEAAASEDLFDTWPIRPRDVLLKQGPTPKSAGSTAAEKAAAAAALPDVLHLADAMAVEGQRVLVYDDVCTTGNQLDAVARFLLDRGACSVEGLVLARTGWS